MKFQVADSAENDESESEDATLQLRAGLKSCHSVVDDYRAKLAEIDGPLAPTIDPRRTTGPYHKLKAGISEATSEIGSADGLI
jgi:hypothetical protein